MSNKNKLILEEAVFHFFLINWTGAASKFLVFLAQHIMDTNTLWTWPTACSTRGWGIQKIMHLTINPF